jgi:hypothetical protein
MVEWWWNSNRHLHTSLQVGFNRPPATEHFTVSSVFVGLSLSAVWNEMLRPSFIYFNFDICRSGWARGLRGRSVAANLLRLWVITRLEGSYRLWCVVCDLENSWMRRPWPTGGCHAKNKETHPSKIVCSKLEINTQACYATTVHIATS